MTTIKTICDMGQIKIFNDGMSCFFDNGVGDVETTIRVVNKEPKDLNRYEFLGHFTVKKGEAYLSHYDCGDEPEFAFKKGRYFVYRVSDANLLIVKTDNDIHS